MNIVHFERLDSTNLYAKTHIDELSDRAIVSASHQTSGRGRLMRSWLDLGDNNLFMSIVLKPQLSNLETYANLTQYLSVVLCKILEESNLQPSIKWPNDVLISGKKIAGILSESVIQGNTVRGIVLGIGVNLNVSEENLKLVTDKEVTSLNLELEKEINVEEFKTKLCDKFFENYDKFLKSGFEYIKSDYIQRIGFFDSEISVKSFNSVTTGIAKSISDKGELILEKDNKEIVLNIGDIL